MVHRMRIVCVAAFCDVLGFAFRFPQEALVETLPTEKAACVDHFDWCKTKSWGDCNQIDVQNSCCASCSAVAIKPRRVAVSKERHAEIMSLVQHSHRTNTPPLNCSFNLLDELSGDPEQCELRLKNDCAIHPFDIHPPSTCHPCPVTGAVRVAMVWCCRACVQANETLYGSDSLLQLGSKESKPPAKKYRWEWNEKRTKLTKVWEQDGARESALIEKAGAVDAALHSAKNIGAVGAKSGQNKKCDDDAADKGS